MYQIFRIVKTFVVSILIFRDLSALHLGYVDLFVFLGGILADDMGLGKTLTLISLILKQKEIFDENPNRDELEHKEKEEWLNKKGNINSIRSKATLVICPASLIGH